VSDKEIDTAVAAFRNWLLLQRDAETAEWHFTLTDAQRAVVITTEKKTLA
jgi:hypothetical protein